jgi:FkbM family methyltransferase
MALQDTLSFADLGTFNREELESAIRARVQTVHLGGARVLARVLAGPKMFLSADDLGFGCHVMLDGYWESWLTVFFARFVSPGMTVFDVGANFGYYTVLFAAGVGSSGRVVAIEPVPSTAAYLNDTIQLNGYAGFTRVVEAAASEGQTREIHLVVPQREPKNATVVAEPRADSIMVATCTIDDLAAEMDRVDLIKIDVEGAEIAVVAGMQQTIARHRPSILLEYNAARYADPRGFLDSLLTTYGEVKSIGWNGIPVAISADTILSDRLGEDWLLFFSGSRA